MSKLKKLMLLCAAFALTASMGLVTACGGGDNSSSSSAGGGDSTSEDSSSDSSSEDPQPAEPVNAFEEVAGLTYDDMASVTAQNEYGTPTPITVNFPSAGKYVLFTDTQYANVGDNYTEGNYGTAYQIEVEEAGEQTYAVFYDDYGMTEESTATVNYYVYKLVDVELDMNGGTINALGFEATTLFSITPPTAGRYMISFSSEVSINDVLKTTHIVETMEDAERIEFLVKSEAIANMAYYTVEYTITEAPAVSVTAGSNEVTIMAGCDNLFSFTTETAGEYKLVCDSEDVIFGIYDPVCEWIDYYSTYTYYEEGAAKNAGLFFTAEAGVPLKFYAKVSADPAVDTSVTFTISPLTPEEKYPTSVTINDMDYSAITVGKESSVDVAMDNAIDGATYIINWSTYDTDLVLKLGNVEFINGTVFFVYTEGMNISFVNKSAEFDASASDVQYQPAQYCQVNDTFDVYVNGDNVSSLELVFNVTWNFAPANYQLTWNSSTYRVGSKTNSTTDGATGLTFENISGNNPIMTAVAPSDVEGAICFSVEEKVDPATALTVGSNTVAIGTNGTTNVVLSTAAAGKFVIFEVTGGDFLVQGPYGMQPATLPFVFETYDMNDGTFVSPTYQVGSMENEVTFVIYAVTELAEGENAIAVPAGETVYATYSNTVSSSVSTSTVALASDETTAKVEVYAYNESTYVYEWVEVTDTLEFATEYWADVMFRITSTATEADTANFTITTTVVEE